MAIKAIIFDYFGVICSDHYWQLVKQDKNVQSAFGDLSNQVNTGEMTWGEFVQTLSQKTGTPAEEIHHLYESEQLDPRMLAYISELKKTYKTALLTNAHHELLDPLIKKSHLHEVFDEVIISSKVGFIKPEPGIYINALQKLNLQPDEAVFIDDIVRNVDGAKAVGMHGILFEDFKTFKSELSGLLKDS